MVGCFETGPKKEKALQQAQAVMEVVLLFWVTWPGNLCGSEGTGGRKKHWVMFTGSSDRKISWMEEPGRLPSMGLHRVGHD